MTARTVKVLNTTGLHARPAGPFMRRLTASVPRSGWLKASAR
jgi:phosphotransferase system HPr-like phosphotransfer protein